MPILWIYSFSLCMFGWVDCSLLKLTSLLLGSMWLKPTAGPWKSSTCRLETCFQALFAFKHVQNPISELCITQVQIYQKPNEAKLDDCSFGTTGMCSHSYGPHYEITAHCTLIVMSTVFQDWSCKVPCAKEVHLSCPPPSQLSYLWLFSDGSSEYSSWSPFLHLTM